MNDKPAENDHGITTELITDILANVKLVLKISNSLNDKLLTLYITALCNNILIKTNRRMFVPELKYVIIDLVIDKFNSNPQNMAELQSIQSMSEAGRSVNFGVPAVMANRLNLLAQKQLDENELLINKFKLLYKT